MEKSAEHAHQPRAISMAQEPAVQREAASAIPHRSVDHARRSSMHHATQERLNNDIWTSAISRLQAQVSYNTGMLESHRRQFTEIEAAVGRLNEQMSEVMHVVSEVQREVRARPMAAEQHHHHDPGDLEVVAKQLQLLTNRVNEIDGLNMQIDLVKNRMKRLEDGNAPIAQGPHRPPSEVYREQAAHDSASSAHSQHQPQQQQQQHHPLHLQQQQHHPLHLQQQQHHPLHSSQHTQLPPMRTGSMASPAAGRPPTLPTQASLDTQTGHSARPSPDTRLFSGDAQTRPPPASSLFRPTEALPPPSALSSWRPAEQHRSGLSPTRSISGPGPNATESEMHHGNASQPSGWSAVNTSSAIKRSPEDRPSDLDTLEASKRPRLAPLMPNSMPRSSHGEEVYGHSHPQFQSMTSIGAEGHFQPRSRAPSDGSQTHPAAHHNFRFVTSTQQPEPQEPWRAEGLAAVPTGHGTSTRGNGRGRGRGRGKGRGRGGAGGGSQSNGPEAQEHSTPEWERAEAVAGHMSPNGHFVSGPSHSPKSVYRSTPSGSFVGDRPSEYPATPVNQGSPHESHLAHPDAPSSGSAKKTRTKPIRNAEGILIRKDGRPDMRSVSSANNLRKVHAKKEAGRAEHDDEGNGITRSGTPTSVAAGEEAYDDHGSDTPQDRHREILHRILSDDRSTRERSTPTQDAVAPPAPRSDDGSGNAVNKKEDIKSVDVVMREPEAPVEEHTQEGVKPFAALHADRAPPPVTEGAVAA